MTNTKNTESKKSTRFENKQTVLKGEYINLDTVERTQFEITVPYVRSEKLALDAAYKALELDKNFIIDSRKFEIVNEKSIPVRYSNTKLYDNRRDIFATEEEAKAACLNGETVKSVSLYTVASNVWTLDNTSEYHTHKVSYETPVNITKSDARAFVKMRFEEESDEQVLALHDTKKEENTFFVVIEEEALKRCIIEKKHTEK